MDTKKELKPRERAYVRAIEERCPNAKFTGDGFDDYCRFVDEHLDEYNYRKDHEVKDDARA